MALFFHRSVRKCQDCQDCQCQECQNCQKQVSKSVTFVRRIEGVEKRWKKNTYTTFISKSNFWLLLFLKSLMPLFLYFGESATLGGRGIFTNFQIDIVPWLKKAMTEKPQKNVTVGFASRFEIQKHSYDCYMISLKIDLS